MFQGSTIIGGVSGTTGVVKGRIGAGAYGFVHAILLANGVMAAIKVLKKGGTPEQEAHIRSMAAVPPPRPTFKGWPRDAGRDAKQRLFFLMDLVPSHFVRFDKLRFLPSPMMARALSRMCINLSDAIESLADQGRMFNDLSPNQIFADPATGEVAIVDCDNICFEDEPRSATGTPGYIPPACASGKESPSMATDAYALGGVLFLGTVGGHPLLGRLEAMRSCLAKEDYLQLFVKNPLFVFDPRNKANRPDPGSDQAVMTANWKRLPGSLRAAFTHNFTVGLKDTSVCLLASQWRDQFAGLADSIFECVHCRGELFDDPEQTSFHCVSCGKKVPRPSRLSCSGRLVAISNGTELYGHHVSNFRTGYDFNVAARVVRGGSQNPRFVGLKNLSAGAWSVRHGDKPRKIVPPGGVAPLPRNTRIQFHSGVSAILV